MVEGWGKGGESGSGEGQRTGGWRVGWGKLVRRSGAKMGVGNY